MSKTLLVVIVVAVLALGAGYYFMMGSSSSTVDDSMTMDESNEPLDTTSGDMTDTSVTDTGASAGDEVTLAVGAKNFSFSPSTLTLKKGQKVKLVFTSSGGFHDFTVDELNVKTKRVDSGASDTVEFTPTKTGTFEFYCSVGNHRAMGMKGTLTVTE